MPERGSSLFVARVVSFQSEKGVKAQPCDARVDFLSVKCLQASASVIPAPFVQFSECRNQFSRSATLTIVWFTVFVKG